MPDHKTDYALMIGTVVIMPKEFVCEYDPDLVVVLLSNIFAAYRYNEDQIQKNWVKLHMHCI